MAENETQYCRNTLNRDMGTINPKIKLTGIERVLNIAAIGTGLSFLTAGTLAMYGQKDYAMIAMYTSLGFSGLGLFTSLINQAIEEA